MHCCPFWLALLIFSLSVKCDYAFEYDAFGVFYGGYSLNILPSSHNSWLRAAVGVDGDAAVLRAVMCDPNFYSIAVQGSLSDHLAFLSKAIALIVLSDGTNEDIAWLEERLMRIAGDQGRPGQFRTAIPPVRIKNIVSGLKRGDAFAVDDLQSVIGRPSMYILEEPLVERTMLLIMYKTIVRKPGRLKDILAWYARRFLIPGAGTQPVRVRATPDAANILARIAAFQCKRLSHNNNISMRALVDFMQRLMVRMGRHADLLVAIGWELQRLDAVYCFNRITPDLPVPLVRAEVLPRLDPLPRPRLTIRHSPAFLNDFVISVGSRHLTVVPTEEAAREDSSLADGWQIDMELVDFMNDEGTLVSHVEGTRLLVVKIRRGLESSSTSGEPISDFDTFHPASSSLDSSDSYQFDQADSSLSDSGSFSSSPFSSTWKSILSKVSFTAVPCAKKCQVGVRRGDMVLILDHPSATTLSPGERIVLAWATMRGSPREQLLQAAAALNLYTFHHLLLVE